MNEPLELYKIPGIDTNMPQSMSNPADINIGSGGNVSGSTIAQGLSEQQVRNIVGQNISTGLKEDQVRAIINAALGPTLGTIISEDQVRNIVGIAMRGANVMTEAKVREIVNSMQRFLTGNNIMMTGIQKSQNFVAGVLGWQIDAEGNAEFNDGTFRGRFDIGGTTITINTSDDIQENLDIIDAAGGGTLYLQNGTYTLTADILIPSTVTMQGVSRDGVIIDCNTLYKVSMTGSNIYSTGTVTINNGATSVVGSGTTWTSAMVGRHILLDGLWYEITAFVSTTNLTIDTYQGDNLAGAAYVLATINDNASLNKVTITNATGVGLSIQYAMEPNLFDLVIYACGTGIDMDYVTYPKLQVTANENGVNINMNFVEGFAIDFSESSYSTTGAGIIMTNTRNSTFFNSSVNDNTADGINMTTCSRIAFISFDISGNGGQGIEFVSGCNDNQMTDGVLDGNTSDGIKLTATSDRNTFVAMSVTNNGGYGINIAASTCDDNQIIAPAFTGNTSGTISDSGTGTFISPQNTFAPQEVVLSAGTETPTAFVATSNSTGTVLFVGYVDSSSTTTAKIVRFLRDSSGTFNETHRTTLTITANGLLGMAVLGSYLYVKANIAAVGSLRRYDLADLANVTTMTISGTNDLSNSNGFWADGTSLWTYSSASTGRVYAVSGTTATAGGTTSFTSSSVWYGAISNSTNVWISDTINYIGSANIRKYAIAGGAVVNTTSPIIYTNAYPSGNPANGLTSLFLSGTNILGIAWTYSLCSDTAKTAIMMHLTGITLP